MAETVKKSRIVSEADENLEESLLEEFNLRLKKCMSRDNLQTGDGDESHIYENVEIIKTNGVMAHCNGDSSRDFLQNEREHYGLNGSEIEHENLDVIKCNVEKLDAPQPSLNLPTCLITAQGSQEMDNAAGDSKSVKDRMFLSTDDASCLLFTQTVTSPMLTPSEENIDFLKGFGRESSQNTLSDNTNSSNSPKSEPKLNDSSITNNIENVEHIYENVKVCENNAEDFIVNDLEQLPIETNLKEEISKFIECERYFKENGIVEVENREVVEPEEIVEPVKSPTIETANELDELKSLNIMKQINRFENTVTAAATVADNSEELTNICSNLTVSTVTETRFVETTTETRSTNDVNNLKKKKTKKSKNQHEKENISVNETNINEEESFFNVNVKSLCRSFGDLTKIEGEQYRNWKNDERSKSSFSKFDALQKKNILNSKAADQENGVDTCNCKKCGRPVFQMEKVIAERCVWHRNCFRCIECSKQLLVDNFESHEGVLYCKPHFKALFAPKAVEDDVPASDKPDLGLEELHSLNVKERFQVFENVKTNTENQMEKNTVKMERSPSILSKLARFQAKGMNVGVTDDSLNGVPIEVSSSEEEEEDVDDVDGEDADLIRAKRVQKEKPFHFSQMSDVKNKWEQGNQQKRDDLREERKQEIQNIRSRLFLGKQGKMKEAYQQAIVESESGSNLKKEVPIESADTRSIKDRFEKGDIINDVRVKETEDMSVFESGISKKSRSIFQELDASSGVPQKISPTSPPKLGNSVRTAREAYLAKQSSEDTVRSSDQVDEITVRTTEIQDRFKFFETYKEPQQKRKEFRMTPPREGQNKSTTPERDVYHDPDIVRSEDHVEDSVVAKATHTATKMLNKFRQMEENLTKNEEPQGLKPLKRFTPPREPIRQESSSGEESGSEPENDDDDDDEIDTSRIPEQDLIEAQKAARAKKLRAKFERWEENEVRRENSINVMEEIGDEQSQIETARSLRAKFEMLRESNGGQKQQSRIKVNRFV